MADRVRTYPELQNAVLSLPAPKPGHVRVFRGQPNDYGRMLPTAFRYGKWDLDLWHAYAMFLARDLQEPLVKSQPHPRASIMDYLLWVRAIAQHYGPGSEFLDVTRSLELALWFALHEAKSVSGKGVMGPDGPVSTATDVATLSTWVKYERTKGPHGWVYVFDVTKWCKEGEPRPAHGDLIDLSEAPSIFFSPRVKVQEACLLAGDSKIEGGDLRSFYACEPFQVSSSIEDAPGLNRLVEELFPLPDTDKWYARLLSIPHVLRVKPPPEPALYFSRPLDIRLYLPSNVQELKKFYKYDVGISPPLVYQHLLNQPERSLRIELGSGASARFDQATPILLEAPLMFSTPPANSDMWNVGVLVADIDRTAEVLDLFTGEALGVVETTNAFIEFSPLETPVIGLAGEPLKIEIIRAIWLVREEEVFYVTLYVYSYDYGAYVAGPIVLHYNRSTRHLEFRAGKNSSEWRDLAELGSLKKGILTALMILRDLSPSLKLLPFPMVVADRSRLVIGVARSISRLEKIPMKTKLAPVSYFLPKYVKSRKPYLGPYAPGEEGLERVAISQGRPFSALDEEAVRILLEKEKVSESPSSSCNDEKNT